MTDYGVHALAIGPHPDDVELFCGGIVARLVQLGHTVGICDLTRGELASHGTPDTRAREAAEASEVLGLAFRDNLGLPDTELAPDTAQVTALVGELRARRPELVLAPWPDDRHPDHVAAGELARRAVFFAGVRKFGTGERFVPRQVLYYAMRARMVPSFVIDTSAAAATKMRAIACYASQVQRPPGGDATLLSAPGGAKRRPPYNDPDASSSEDPSSSAPSYSVGAVAAIEARDRFYGSMIGASHGEPVRTAATPGLVDPIRHARDNHFPEAHAFEAREP